jgi:hypothetical protein
MLKMVDGTGIIGVDMVCPLGGAVSPPQPPNYDNVEMEGVGSLVLPNSLKAPIERLELIGNSVQLTTTGKNLANPSEFVIGTLAGNTGNIINLKQYFTTGYIPVIPGKRYSTSCGNKFSAHTIIAYDKEKTKINSPINMSSEMPEGAAYIRQAYRKIDMTNVTESDMEELKKVCMVNEGSTVLPYEPYTGGKPSPSPEYPQEIKSAGKWNEETQKYEVDVKITNAEQNWSKEQTLTITSDRPITKWDRLVEQGGEYGWLYGTGKITLTGNEKWIAYSDYKSFYTVDYDILLKPNPYCTHYIYGNLLASDGNNVYAIGVGAYYNSLWIKDNRFNMNLQDFKAYLSDAYTKGDPVTVLYNSKATEFVPLSQEEQTQLRNLHSYNGTTNIMVDSGEVECGIKLTYRKEI